VVAQERDVNANDKRGEGAAPPALKKDWRFYAGLVAMAAAIILPLAAIFVPLLGLSTAHSAVLVGILVAGGPEVLCILAVVLLGKDTFNYLAHLAKTAVRRAVVETPASRTRYYLALAVMLVSWLPAYLYAYLPSAFPGGDTRIYILAAMDLAFCGKRLSHGGRILGEGKADLHLRGQGLTSRSLRRRCSPAPQDKLQIADVDE